jgi:hypothetical protein
MQVTEKNGKLCVYKLVEMEHNIKIQNLLKKGLFQEAYAEICKVHADQLYDLKKDYD